MIIPWKSVFAFLLTSCLAGTGSLCYSQSMQGFYMGTAVITSYDSSGKKTSESIPVSADIDSLNNFSFAGGVLSYNGTLIIKGKVCAVYARVGDNNYNFRGKLKPGKGVSGTLYWITPTDFFDVKVKLKSPGRLSRNLLP